MTERKYVLGVDIGGTNLRVALADIGGAILARTSSTTMDTRDAHQVVAKVKQCAAQLVQETGIALETLASVGVGAPGVTNAETGVVIATSYLMGWRDIPLKTMLQDVLRIPAAIENDVNLAALGEHSFGAGRETPTFVFLALGTGVGAGIILRGELFQGAAWTAGEVGYMLVPGVSEKPPALGQPGGLEELVGGEGLHQRWLRLWDSSKTSLPPDLTATQIFDAAIAGDALATSILERACQALACVIFNITLILDAPLFILGGSVGLHPALRDRTQRIVDAHARRLHPQLVPSSLGGDAQLAGAIRLAQLAAQKQQ
jgi:glucokinase